MMHTKFFFSIALLLSISTLPAMEKTETESEAMFKVIAQMAQQSSDDLAKEISKLNSFGNEGPNSVLPKPIANALESNRKLADALNSHEKPSDEIENNRKDDSNDPAKAHLNFVLQKNRTHREQEKARQLKVKNFSQIEWLAKACKEFHTSNYETEETKSFTLNALSSIEALVQRLKSNN